jgi:hypothetical protein
MLLGILGVGGLRCVLQVRNSSAYLHTRHLKAFHPKAILPFAPSSRAGGKRNKKKRTIDK